ncbi:MAG: glycosyltransferase family 39 protein [Candidatus Dormibacteria bacterium]
MERTTSRTGPASSGAPATAGVARYLARARAAFGRTEILLVLGGLVVRGVYLDLTPLWSDEAFTGVLMRRSIGAMIDVVHNDNHPPLQYLLVRLAAIFGNTPVNLRLPSVVAGAAAVPLAIAIGRRLGGRRVALTSGGVVALMPLLVLWSRDARMYALGTTMVLAMSLALWRATDEPSIGRVGIYGLTVLVGLYTNYLVALAVPAQLLAALLVLRPGRQVILRLAAAAGAAGVALVPWLVYAAPQFRHAGQPYWVQPISVGGTSAQLQYLASHPGPTTLGAVAIALAVPLVAALTVAAYRSCGELERRGTLYVLACGGFSLLFLVIVSLKRPLLDERFINVYLIQLLPVAGLALAAPGRRWLVGGAMIVLLALTVVEVSALPTPHVPEVTAYLDSHVDASRDTVALVGAHQYFPVLYYAHEPTRQVVRVVDIDVHWYDGLAGFRRGDLVPAVPRVAGATYVVVSPDQGDPPLPDGLHLARRACSPGVCLETWTH